MLDADNAIKKAYYSALNSIAPFYIQVPSGTAYPYIYNSDFNKVPNRNKDRFGWDVTVTLVIVSKFSGNSGGQSVNDGIAQQIEQAVVGSSPGQNPLSFGVNFTNAVSELITSTTMPPQDVADGTVYYKILKFKHTIQQFS